MKKLFVPYEIAKQLKEKGFDEVCFTNYSKKGTLMSVDSTSGSINTDLSDYEYCSAPLYQQVIDWLRDKHKLYISIYRVRYYIDESHCWSLDYINNEAKITKSYPNNKSMVGVKEKDYYTALTKAIEEALKLIY